ncbi:MAG: SulP family inorganic anion transporter [Bacteroidetes bacterium]|nr:SulP family inorganic anion transporter [Bacteroidota bacterium]
MNTNKKTIPKTGWLGFKENWKDDLLSGLLVSLIALPLSLGIASASGFPPIMGVITAITGGIVVSFFAGSELTIKGPAAGLIVICSGAVEALGNGNAEQGWHLAVAVVAAAGIIQILFGWLKIAKFADFFPLSAVHGMLAAIGIIIMAKQLHFALGVDPNHIKGKDPLELILMLPDSFLELNTYITTIGIVSLVILFGMPLIKHPVVKKIPPALVVIIVAIALEKLFHLEGEEFKNLRPLVNPGDFQLSFNADFSAITDPELISVFLYYLMMFALVGTLESLLTGKAIDLLDPYKRKANLSKDVTSVGIGNVISGLLGGLPMISEVARSSANIHNGGKTRWANLFHGIFLLIFVVLLVPVIKLIPVVALSSLLIFVGFRLAHPSSFSHTYHLGKEQLAIFIVTIVTTVATDLLIGIGAGILLKFIIHFYNGLSLKSVFKPHFEVREENKNEFTIVVDQSAVFSNYLAFKKALNSLPRKKTIIIDFSSTKLIDHSVMDNLHNYMNDYVFEGGKFDIIGIEKHKALSEHKLAARKLKRKQKD